MDSAAKLEKKKQLGKYSEKMSRSFRPECFREMVTRYT